MSKPKFNAEYANKRIGEIKYSIEMLHYGLTELEAVYLRIKSGVVNSKDEKEEAVESARILNARNHCLAHAINKALKEVESNFKMHTEAGIDIDKEVTSEFSAVLKESIRTLQQYYLIHENYQKKENEKVTDVPISKKQKKSKSKAKAGHKKDPDEYSMTSLQKFQRMVKRICICGSETNQQ